MFKAENYSLANLNAFRFNHSAKNYIECQTHEELLNYANHIPVENGLVDVPIVFGNGSNTVLTGDINKTVLRYTGTEVNLKEQPDSTGVVINVQAGKNWHELVIEMTRQGYQGLENLSLIPGTCGAAPVQNIGAYGVELKDILVNVTAFNWQTRKFHSLSKNDCEFAYRDSVFKKRPGEYCITDISLKLNKEPELVTSYEAIQSVLVDRCIAHPTPMEISEIVCEIRQSKLPDPNLLPNAGSFFKNPVIDFKTFESLSRRYPGIPNYNTSEGRMKVAAGWLIDAAGLKGFRHVTGKVGVHEKQALVLVNYNSADASELIELAEHVQNVVLSKFGIPLEWEPVVR